jgi:hypothetical protein
VLGDGEATCEHGKPHVDVVSQKEPYFPPPICGFRHSEVEVGIDSMPRFDIDVCAAQNCHFRTLRELSMKEVAQEIEVGFNPPVGPA